MKTIIHLTLNTWDSRVSPRSEVSDSIIETLRPLLTQETFDLPIPEGCRVLLDKDRLRGRAAFTILIRAQPIVTCTLAYESHDDAAWALASGTYKRGLELIPEYQVSGFAKPLPAKPTTAPWLAVQLWPGLAQLDRESVMMLGDMERCLAWALLEEA